MQISVSGSGEGEFNTHTGTISIIAGNSGSSSIPGSAAAPTAAVIGNAGGGSGGAGAPVPSCGLTPAPASVIAPGSAGLSFAPVPGQQGPNSLGQISAIQPGTAGSWYLDTCNTTLNGPLPVFVAGGSGPAPGPAVPVPPSPAQLAQIAYGEIQLGAPGLQLSPASQANPAIDQIVGAPTWAWVPAAAWTPLSATATAGPVVVTATATPTEIQLSYTDGSQPLTTICNGPGTPYSDGLAALEDPGAPFSAASPDCGWTYRHTSAAAGGKEPVTGVVTYGVTWSVTGAPGGGNLGPLNSPATTYEVAVAEIQVLNTD